MLSLTRQTLPLRYRGEVNILFDSAIEAACVSPNHICPVVISDCHPHVVTEKTGLNWIIGNHQVRHRRCGNPSMFDRWSSCGWVADGGQGDVVTACDLAKAVRAIIVCHVEGRAVWHNGTPRHPLRAARRS